MKFIHIFFFTVMSFVLNTTGNETLEVETTAVEHGSAVTVSLNHREKQEEITAITIADGENNDNVKENESTPMVNPVEEAAEDVANNHDDTSEVENRENEDFSSKENVSKKSADESGSIETVETAPNKEHVLRAKRVSKAGSSHMNRPSTVERLSSNSNGNKANDEEIHNEYEFDTFQE